MKGLAYLLRFFQVVSPQSALVVWTFGVLVVVAASVVVFAPERTAGAFAPLLLMQMFAASSGFAVPARRGHYDLLLTRTGDRVLIALAHWIMSIAAGLASWLIVASIEILRTGSASISLASGTCAAVWLVSTIPWAVTIALPRFSGGIGWLLVLTAGTLTFSLPDISWVSAQWQPSPATAFVFLLYPIVAVGRHLSSSELIAVAPATMIAVGAMAVACGWVGRAALPLEAAQ